LYPYSTNLIWISGNYRLGTGCRTFPADRSAFFTVLHISVFFTFYGTGQTNPGTFGQHAFGVMRPPGYEHGCLAAYRCAVKVKFYTMNEILYNCIVEAGYCAMVAGCRAAP
jgi:hypothetical protein